MWREFPAGTPQLVRAPDTPHWMMTLTPLVDAPRSRPDSPGQFRSNVSSTAASATDPIIFGPRVPSPSDLAHAMLTATAFERTQVASVQAAGMSAAVSDDFDYEGTTADSVTSVESTDFGTWFR